MSRRLVALIVPLVLLLPSSLALAQEQEQASENPGESPRNFMLEVRLGRYKPAIDAEPGLTAQPYQQIFGGRSMWLFGAEFDYYLYKGFGTAALGFSAGFGTVSGHGIIPSEGQPSPDTTSLRTIPLALLAVYRFDYLAREIGIPLVPFGKIGVADTLWWMTRGDGSIATFDSNKAFGGKWGWQAAAGLAFELNFIDPAVGREFDHDVGVNRVLLFGEYMQTSANNFGRKGLDLSGHSWQFGLAFEF